MLNLLGHLLILTNTFLRANEKLFISKALRWAILLRSRIKNLCLKNKADLNWGNYENQRNFCTNLRENKKKYFYKLNMTKVNDSKKFQKTISSFFLTDV